MSPPAPVLETRALVKRFGGLAAVDGVDFILPAVGRLHAVIGPNGAGKTTFFNLVSGRLRPTSGAIIFRGKNITGLKPYRIARLGTTLGLMPRSAGRILFMGRDITRLPGHKLAGLGIGYVPQGRGIFPLLTVMENLCLGLKGRPDPDRLDEIFARFPRLRERASQAGGTLSGGEQQMLAIARCLMTGPRLLILDEPTEGIMPILVADIRRTIHSINRSGVAVLLVEQNVKTALRICGRVYLMEKGRIAHEGTSAALRADPQTIHRYLGLSLQPT